MIDSLDDDSYSNNEDQIMDLKSTIYGLMTVMASSVADLSSASRGPKVASGRLINALDILDPERNYLREQDPESPYCFVESGYKQKPLH
jgi:hypothetical protein